MTADIIGVIVWCLAVYVCAYDWDGNKFPEMLCEEDSKDEGDPV